MADITKKDLIHAGLPWTNPEKITVKSDEYISQLVINRGLLSLLSNDYYLDLKAQRINQYIEDIINQHMDDDSIHFTLDDIKPIIKQIVIGGGDEDDDSELDLYTGLRKDTSYILPLYKDSNDNLTSDSILQIKNTINNCTRNLNGKNLVFLFSIPSSQWKGSDAPTNIIDYYEEGCEPLDIPSTYNLSTENFSFDGFYGGNLIVMGNDMFIIDDSDTGDTKSQIYQKPLNGTQTRILLEQIQNRLLSTNVNNSKITLKGSGLNTNFSVLSFRNCATDSYLWNLSLNNNRAIGEQYTEPTPQNPSIPTFYDLIYFYPLINKYTDRDKVHVLDYNPEIFDTIKLKSELDIYASNDSLLSTELNVNTESKQFTCLNNNYIYYDAKDPEDIENPTLKDISNKIRSCLYGKYYKNGKIYNQKFYKGCTLVFWMKQDFKENNYDKVPIIYDYDQVNGNGFYIGLDGVYTWEDGQIVQRHQTDYLGKLKGNKDVDNLPLFYIIYLSGYVDHTDNDKNKLQIKMSFAGKNVPLNSQCSCSTNCTCGCKTNVGRPLISEGLSDITISDWVFNSTANLKLFGTDQITTNGYIRNLLLFKKHLTLDQLSDIYQNNSIPTDYEWPTRTNSLSDLINNKIYSSLYVYNTNMLNVIGCKLTQDNTGS